MNHSLQFDAQLGREAQAARAAAAAQARHVAGAPRRWIRKHPWKAAMIVTAPIAICVWRIARPADIRPNRDASPPQSHSGSGGAPAAAPGGGAAAGLFAAARSALLRSVFAILAARLRLLAAGFLQPQAGVGPAGASTNSYGDCRRDAHE